MKTPKLSPFTHIFGRGIKGKRSMKGSCIHPPTPNPQEKGLKIANRKNSPRKGSGNHQKKTGETKPSLEEPRRIIYTYHEGSYKVYLATRSSFPLTRSHQEALKLVQEIPKEKEEENSKTKMS
jgi:hypothetical protein